MLPFLANKDEYIMTLGLPAKGRQLKLYCNVEYRDIANVVTLTVIGLLVAAN